MLPAGEPTQLLLEDHTDSDLGSVTGWDRLEYIFYCIVLHAFDLYHAGANCCLSELMARITFSNVFDELFGYVWILSLPPSPSSSADGRSGQRSPSSPVAAPHEDT